jgi:16S rRNA (guanine527-N7)-methyltransferase
MQETSAASLRARAERLNVTLDAAMAQRLLRLLDELRQWNRAYNLTAIEEPAAMVSTHLLDSLAANGELAGARIADVGTGAGFPGLPLAIANPQRQFTLIDATAKKVRFVAHAARTLELANVEAVQARAESMDPAQPFDTVLARAVGSLAELARLAQPLSRPGTRLVAYKGRRPEAELAQLPAGWRLEAVRGVQVPDLEAERCLVVLVAIGADPTGPQVLPQPSTLPYTKPS